MAHVKNTRACVGISEPEVIGARLIDPQSADSDFPSCVKYNGSMQLRRRSKSLDGDRNMEVSVDSSLTLCGENDCACERSDWCGESCLISTEDEDETIVTGDYTSDREGREGTEEGEVHDEATVHVDGEQRVPEAAMELPLCGGGENRKETIARSVHVHPDASALRTSAVRYGGCDSDDGECGRVASEDPFMRDINDGEDGRVGCVSSFGRGYSLDDSEEIPLEGSLSPVPRMGMPELRERFSRLVLPLVCDGGSNNGGSNTVDKDVASTSAAREAALGGDISISGTDCGTESERTNALTSWQGSDRIPFTELLPSELWVYIMGFDGMRPLACTCRYFAELWRQYIGLGRIKVRELTTLMDISEAVEKRALPLNQTRLLIRCKTLRDHHLRFLAGSLKVILKQCSRVTDGAMEWLKEVHSITLDRCRRVTDEGIRILGTGRVKRLKLVLMDISNEALEGLDRLDYVRLINCRRISDSGLAHLHGVQSVTLTSLPLVGDTGVKHLRDVRRLKLTNLSVTDDALSVHSRVQILHLTKCANLTDECLKYISNVETIIVAGCPLIRGSGVGALAGARYVSIPGCPELGDAEVSKLAGVQIINLTGCENVTDVGICALKGVSSIILQGVNVTDVGVAALAGAHRVSLRGCSNVTDVGVRQLRGVRVLDLTGCNITDAALHALKGVHTINLSKTARITEMGISALRGVWKIRISECPEVGDEAIRWLSSAHTVILRRCDRITDASLHYLGSVDTLHLASLPNITDKGLVQVRNVRSLSIVHCDGVTVSGLACLDSVQQLTVTGVRTEDQEILSKLLPNCALTFVSD